MHLGFLFWSRLNFLNSWLAELETLRIIELQSDESKQAYFFIERKNPTVFIRVGLDFINSK